LLPERFGLTGRQRDLETGFAGIAGRGNEPVADTGRVEGLQRFGGGACVGPDLPDTRLGVRALHGDDRQVAARHDGDIELPVGEAGSHPGEILLGGAGVDDHAVLAVGDEIDDQVVDDAAGFVEHGAVERLAGFLELVDVVGDEAQQEGPGIGAGDIDGAHVRDVEHAAVAAHGMVFLDLRTVVKRHVPAAEIDHAGAKPAMGLVEDSFLSHFKSLEKGVEFRKQKKGELVSSSPPCPWYLRDYHGPKAAPCCPIGGRSVQLPGAALQSSLHERSFCLSVFGWIAPSAAGIALSALSRSRANYNARVALTASQRRKSPAITK